MDDQAAKYQELGRRHMQLIHAMQSGVAMSQQQGDESGSPKHLRVGVNAAMSDHAGLVDLLIRKGVITQVEYGEAIVEFMGREVARYEAELSATLGTKITLA